MLPDPATPPSSSHHLRPVLPNAPLPITLPDTPPSDASLSKKNPTEAQHLASIGFARFFPEVDIYAPSLQLTTPILARLPDFLTKLNFNGSVWRTLPEKPTFAKFAGVVRISALPDVMQLTLEGTVTFYGALPSFNVLLQRKLVRGSKCYELNSVELYTESISGAFEKYFPNLS